MQIINHELARRVAGLRLFCVVICGICLINLVRWILAPTAEVLFVNQSQMMLNLIYVILTAAFIYYLNDKNYLLISSAAVILFIFYYFVLEMLNDYNNSIANPDKLGIGRELEIIPLLPLTFIISGVLFLRKSLLLIFIAFFTLMCGFNVYEIIINERTYFTSDWNTAISDGFAIYTPVFVIWLNVWIIICIICMASVYLIDRLMRDAIKFEKSTAQFGRYFSPSVREKIQETDLEIKEDENNIQMIAVMFTDIDNFTQLSEKLSSKEIIELLSEYQDRMIKPIFKNSGTVDKFIGDSVMATFGTPVSQGNDAQNAFNCAREMQIAMRQWAKERKDKNLIEITHRIGIHFGSCVVGNIGNEERKEFTVIGDVVNVANRVCDICKELNSEILITENLKNRLNEEINSEEIKDHPIRGKKDKISLFKILI